MFTHFQPFLHNLPLFWSFWIFMMLWTSFHLLSTVRYLYSTFLSTHTHLWVHTLIHSIHILFQPFSISITHFYVFSATGKCFQVPPWFMHCEIPSCHHIISQLIYSVRFHHIMLQLLSFIYFHQVHTLSCSVMLQHLLPNHCYLSMLWT